MSILIYINRIPLVEIIINVTPLSLLLLIKHAIIANVMAYSQTYDSNVKQCHASLRIWNDIRPDSLTSSPIAPINPFRLLTYTSNSIHPYEIIFSSDQELEFIMNWNFTCKTVCPRRHWTYSNREVTLSSFQAHLNAVTQRFHSRHRSLGAIYPCTQKATIINTCFHYL